MSKNCSRCSMVKPLTEFYKAKGRPKGRSNYCRDCEKARQTEYRNNNYERYITRRRMWAEDNKESLSKYNTEWASNNRNKNIVVESRRRARKQELPDTLTHEETDDILKHFDYKCCICDDKFFHLDHFIPIGSGHGGTTKENIVPMCNNCNTSKRDRNPFEWIKLQDDKERERFEILVKYLTDINGMTDSEIYKAHVYNCFE